MTDPCRCACHQSPNHEWLSAAVWEKLERDPAFAAQMDRALATPDEEYVPMRELRNELGDSA